MVKQTGRAISTFNNNLSRTDTSGSITYSSSSSINSSSKIASNMNMNYIKNKNTKPGTLTCAIIATSGSSSLPTIGDLETPDSMSAVALSRANNSRSSLGRDSAHSGSSLGDSSGARSSPSGSSSSSSNSNPDSNSASPSSSPSSSLHGSIQAHSPADSNFSSTSSGNSSSGSNVTAFLSKLWRLVNDYNNNDLICWSQSGCSFVIINQIIFAKDLLPLYFKHSNMASFIRQLNMYGFRKIPVVGANGSADQRTDIAQFYHVNFMRGQERRLVSIRRKNNSSKGHSLVVNSSFCDEVRAILNDVKSIRDGQNSSESILGAIQVDNKSLWHDVAALRSQHNKQRRVVEKLIQFLLSLIQTRSNMVHVSGGSSHSGSGRAKRTGSSGAASGPSDLLSVSPPGGGQCKVAELDSVGSSQTRLDTLGGSQSGSPRVTPTGRQLATCSNSALLSPRRGRSPAAASLIVDAEVNGYEDQTLSLSSGSVLMDKQQPQLLQVPREKSLADSASQAQLHSQQQQQQSQQLRSVSVNSIDVNSTAGSPSFFNQLDQPMPDEPIVASCQQLQQQIGASPQFGGQLEQHLANQEQQLNHNHPQQQLQHQHHHHLHQQQQHQQQQQQQQQQQHQPMQLHQVVNQRGAAIYSNNMQQCFSQHQQHQQQLSLGNHNSNNNRQQLLQASPAQIYCYCPPSSVDCGGLRCQQQQQQQQQQLQLAAPGQQCPGASTEGVYVELASSGSAAGLTMAGTGGAISSNYATSAVETLASSPNSQQLFYAS